MADEEVTGPGGGKPLEICDQERSLNQAEFEEDWGCSTRYTLVERRKEGKGKEEKGKEGKERGREKG